MGSKTFWLRVLVLGAFLALLGVVRLSSAEPASSERKEHPAAAIASEPLLPELSLDKAVEFLDAGARDHETKCINCHASFAYLMARPALPIHTEKHREVRNNLEEWVAYLEGLKLDPTSDSRRRAEAVMSAAVLALHDAATSGTLHAVTHRALDLMWQVQLPDGGYDWLKPNNEPPSAIDNHFGATMAAIAAGAAPAGYASSSEAREHIDKLRGYLTANPPQHIHQRGMLMLADHFLGGLMSEQTRRQTIADMFALQHPDGGWSMAALGDDTWKRKDKTPQDFTNSDGYGTGFCVYVLRTGGEVSVEDSRIQRAIAWLKSHQRTSGGWYSRSPKNSDTLASYVGSTYAILALKVCGEIPCPSAMMGRATEVGLNPIVAVKAEPLSDLARQLPPEGGGSASGAARKKRTSPLWHPESLMHVPSFFDFTGGNQSSLPGGVVTVQCGRAIQATIDWTSAAGGGKVSRAAGTH